MSGGLAAPRGSWVQNIQLRRQDSGRPLWQACVMDRRGFIAQLGKAAVLVLLVISLFAPAIAETSQQDQVITATATGSSESSACSAAQGKAYNLCMVRNFFNIIGVTCTCTQRGSVTASIWECEGTATCKK
jgi:hypothetical protein